MNDVINNIVSAYKERLASAFLFNLLIASIIIHWDAIYITLFVESIYLNPQNKFEYLTQNGHINGSRKLIVSFAAILTLSIPLINLVFSIYKYIIIKTRDWIKLKFDGLYPVTGTKYLFALNQIKAIEKKFNDSITKYDTIDSELKIVKQKNEEILNENVSIQNELENCKSKQHEQFIHINHLHSYNHEHTIVQSDENTYFYTDRNRNSSNKTRIVFEQPNWNISLVNNLNTLRGAFWITHKYPISDDEAMSGGMYILERNFELPSNKISYKSIKLYCIVDDELELEINDIKIKNIYRDDISKGFGLLHEYDLFPHLVDGLNQRLRFYIKNYKMLQTREKNLGELNPYGIIYTVKGILQEPTI